MAESYSLSPQEHQRLRPTVDAATLERLLAAVPPESRPALLILCAADVSDAELAALGFDPAPCPPPPELARAAESGRRAFLPVQHTDFFSVGFDDPELQRLWDAVEPQKDGGG